MKNAILMIFMVAMPGFAGDWNPRLAAKYLDSRQEEWFAWGPAKLAEGYCISCHTGMPYLLARPALRRALGESEPTRYEKGLLDTLRTRVVKNEAKDLFPAITKEPRASQAVGVETILAALFLGSEPESRLALERLWSVQILDGKAKGAWAWFELDLEPWETSDSPFFGASLAALTVGSSSAESRKGPEIQKRIAHLTEYLQREQPDQPLHNRLVQLWASTRLPGVMSEQARRSLIAEVLKKQQADGGWTIESLGTWKKHAQASPSPVSDSYATAFVAFILRSAGVSRYNAAMQRALEWLSARQNPESGSWNSESMNKKREPDSMPARFMQDAATAFAALALLDED